MGNYCSCVFSNNPENKICEIEEIKREKIKLEFSNIEDFNFSRKSFTLNLYDRKELYLKSFARCYVTNKYLAAIKIFRSFTFPNIVIYGPLPTAPEIKQIEETLDCLPLQAITERKM